MKYFLKYCFIFYVGLSFAQSDFSFKHISLTNHGIKKSSLQCFDSNGLMWAVYQDGLFNYTGYGVNKFPYSTNDTSIILSKSIGNIFIDEKNNLWLSYIDNPKITYFNTLTKTSRHYKLNYGFGKLDSEIIVSKFFIDSKNNFWLLTWGAGICLFNPKNGKTTSYLPHGKTDKLKHPERANCVKGIAELKNGDFFLACFGNEYADFDNVFFNPETKQFTNLKVRDYTLANSNDDLNKILYASRISNFVYLDKHENIWLGTYSGLIYFDIKLKTAQRISPEVNSKKLNLENVRNYVIDEDENIWMSTPNLGVMIVNINSKKITICKRNLKIPTTINDNRINYLSKDNQGNIWISTKMGAFSIYNRLQQQFFISTWGELDLDYIDRATQRIPVNQIYVTPQGEMYVANENGILVYDTKEKKIVKNYQPNLYNKNRNIDIDQSYYRVQDIKQISKEEYYITSPNMPGIFNANKSTYKSIEYDTKIRKTMAMRTMFRHQNTGKFVVFMHTVSGRLYVLDTITNKIKLFDSLPKVEWGYKDNYSLVLPNGNWLFSANEKQFTIYDPKNKTQHAFNAKSKTYYFPDSTINMVSLNKKHNLYVSTVNGLYEFNLKTYETKKLNQLIGLNENEFVNTVSEENDSITWIAGEKELIKWNKKINSIYRFTNDLGLPEGGFINSVPQKDSLGKLYFATFNGELIIDPSKIYVPEKDYCLFLNSIIIRDQKINLDSSTITELEQALKWNQNFLTFEFYSEQIFNPTPYKFSYRLLGLDTNWQENGMENKIRYTNLSSGEYTLQVKALNTYNKWSEPYNLKFVITPPFWKTWWFYSLIAICFGLLIKIFINQREKSLLQKQLVLENKVAERTQEVVAKASEIESQKNLIEHKNKELTDSINYALKIQQSILPTKEQIIHALPQHFIFYRPKDIVSGDFYWFAHINNFAFWAAVDCTGHGVPGGFMSMLGSDLLNQIVNEEKQLQPSVILDKLKAKVITALKQTGAVGENKDGMDISLCKLNLQNHELEFAGANNSLLIIRNNELIKLQADKQPIGIYLAENKAFTNHKISLSKNDTVYMTTDGYIDQFGGEKGKKFKSANFEKLVCSISSLTINKQEHKLITTFDNWKENYEQLDDVCVFAVKI